MFKILTDGCEPKKATKYSCAVDVFSAKDVNIEAGETETIPLGIALDIDALFFRWYGISLEEAKATPKEAKGILINPHGAILSSWDNFLATHYIQLAPRSSLRAKGLISGQGYIDIDYKDEIKMIIHNPLIVKYEQSFGTGGLVECDNTFEIKKGDKIGQILLLEHMTFSFGIKTETIRSGGIGSTRDK